MDRTNAGPVQVLMEQTPKLKIVVLHSTQTGKNEYFLPVLPHTVLHFSTMVSVPQPAFQPSKIKDKQIQEWKGKSIITEKDLFPVCHSKSSDVPSLCPLWQEITFHTANRLFKDVLSSQTCISPTSAFWSISVRCICFFIKFVPWQWTVKILTHLGEIILQLISPAGN